MPDSVEMPAPVSTTMRRAASISRARGGEIGHGAAEGCRRRRRAVTASAAARRLAHAPIEQFEGGAREGPHVGFAIGTPGLDGERTLDRTDDGDAGMARGVAVAIAGGTGCAGLGEAPGGAEAFAHRLRLEQGIRLRARADASHGVIRHGQEDSPRHLRVDHPAAEEVGRRPGDGQEAGRHQAPRRRFGDPDRVPPRDEAGGDCLEPIRRAGRARGENSTGACYARVHDRARARVRALDPRPRADLRPDVRPAVPPERTRAPGRVSLLRRGRGAPLRRQGGRSPPPPGAVPDDAPHPNARQAPRIDTRGGQRRLGRVRLRAGGIAPRAPPDPGAAPSRERRRRVLVPVSVRRRPRGGRRDLLLLHDDASRLRDVRPLRRIPVPPGDGRCVLRAQTAPPVRRASDAAAPVRPVRGRAAFPRLRHAAAPRRLARPLERVLPWRVPGRDRAPRASLARARGRLREAGAGAGGSPTPSSGSSSRRPGHSPRPSSRPVMQAIPCCNASETAFFCSPDRSRTRSVRRGRWPGRWSRGGRPARRRRGGPRRCACGIGAAGARRSS